MEVGTSYSANLNAMVPRTCNPSTQEAQTGLKLAWTRVRAFLKKKKEEKECGQLNSSRELKAIFQNNISLYNPVSL